MTASGWCRAPLNALPDHNGCRVAGCDCECGHPQRCPDCHADPDSAIHHADCVAPLDQIEGD